MIKTLATAAFVAAASVSFVTVAWAEDIPATPINHGPMQVTGMGAVGSVMNLGLTPVNVVAPGVIAVGGAVTGAAPMAQPAVAEEAPVLRHRRHHRAHYMKHKLARKRL